MKFVSLGSLLTLCHCASVFLDNLEVEGDCIQLSNDKEVERFRGMSYARRRGMFELPVEVSYDSISGKLDATQPGAICPGIPTPLPIPNMEGFYDSSSHEDFYDCLNLDVYRPKGGQNLKVLVQVHNNRFKGLTRNQAHNQPEGFFRFTDNHVYVSVGTTMGPLAVWYKDESFNNVAVHEVIMALKWVQKYIAAFGGNPDDVTLMGQSTAASLVEIALIYLRDLPKFGFDKSPITNVILASGTGNSHTPVTIEEQTARQQELLSKIPACQANPQDCLAQVTVDDLNAASAESPAFIVPSMDSVNMPAPIPEMRKNGDFLHPQSILVTVNENESAMATVKLDMLFKKFGVDAIFKKANLDFDELCKAHEKHEAVACINRWMNDIFYIRPAQELLREYNFRGISTYEHLNNIDNLKGSIINGSLDTIPGVDHNKLRNTLPYISRVIATNYMDQAALFDAKMFTPKGSTSLKFSEIFIPEVTSNMIAPFIEYIKTGTLQTFTPLPQPIDLSEGFTAEVLAKNFLEIFQAPLAHNQHQA